MKVIGIIAEYNPFHNGHLYQINCIKNKYPDSLIVVIITGSFMQRGNISILSKWDKAIIAKNYKADIVIALPTIFAIQSADIFAKESIYLLSLFKIDILVFGSETKDINKLIKIASIAGDDTFNIKVQEYLNMGNNYPTSLSKSCDDILGFSVNESNDILAISYLKELNKYHICPYNIQRTNSYLGNDIYNNITSATNIRNLYLDNKDITSFIPKYDINLLKKVSNNNLFSYLKYKILVSNNLQDYHLVTEGINNRIKKYINNCATWDEFVNNIKTKRFTYNRINRILINILLDIKKEDIKHLKNDYIRLLSFSNKGRNYINSIKKEINLPIITSYKKNISPTLDKEVEISKLYSLFTKDNTIWENEYKWIPK